MKKKYNILAVLLLAVLLLGVLAACGGNTSADAPAGADSSSAKTQTITDVFGRQVEIPAEVNTCAALGSSARLITYAGGADKIVGVTEMEHKGDPGMPYVYANREHFESCDTVGSGGSANEDYAEALMELAPDVVFYQDSDTVAMEELAKKTGLPVVGVYGDAFNSHYLVDSITLIGDILGTAKHADQVTAAINAWVKDLNDRTKDIPKKQKPRVYTGAVSWSGGHGFTGTYVGYAPLQAINAINLADELDVVDGVEVSMEQILKWDPDIIFLNPGNMELVKKDYASNGDAIDSLRAVKEGKVYSQVDYNYYWCNMELAIVDSYYAGTIIYPEAFADIDFEKKAEEIFNTMIGRDYLKVLEKNGCEFGPITIGE